MSTITVSHVPFALGDSLETLPLFAHLGLDIPESITGDRSKDCVSARCHLKLVWSKPLPVISHDTQLELDFGRANIVDFVPKLRRCYLDYSVRDLAKKEPALDNAARLLSQKGLRYVGDLLAVQRGVLRKVTGLDEGEIALLENLLRQGGLRLEMAIPYWQRPTVRYA